ncbi:MAG: hypothetical protein QCI38_08845, partial [Candidatus Thermoplasmatota archaeon]|nr:hypothetical protein [Candidatus Thermoplasmatota archaeon]
IMVSSDLFLYLFSGRIWPYSSSLLIWIGIFVWTGFAMMALLGLKAGRRTSNPNPLWFAAGTVWGVLLYDIWTNVGWWLGPYYPNTLEGLAACLLMAAPFMAWHMLSTAALLPAAYAGVWFVNKHGSSLASRFARKRPDSALAEGEWEQRLS